MITAKAPSVARSEIEIVLRNFSCAAGAAYTVSHRQMPVRADSRRERNAVREMLTPFERSAINSLSAESRPNRIAVNNPTGW
jgi:hypothetical protein